MPSNCVSIDDGSAGSGLKVVLVSPDAALNLELQRILNALGLRVEAFADGGAAMAALGSLGNLACVLLDARLAGVVDGRLLAAMQEMGARRRNPLALIADEVSDEWIARLREGVIDDIVPRNANVGLWSTHLSTMRRGHQLYCELEELRAAASMELQYDRATGAFNRETMLTLLFRETDRVQRQRGAMCLVLFDIDDFGHWNRELGRDVCDGILREVAGRTGRLLRSYDLLGRIGKDEFLVALPGCGTINAVLMAERLRMDVFSEPFAVPDGPRDFIQVRLTACFSITSSQGRSPVVVLREAEQALRQGKWSGPDSMRCTGEAASAEPVAELATLFPVAEVLV